MLMASSWKTKRESGGPGSDISLAHHPSLTGTVGGDAGAGSPQGALREEHPSSMRRGSIPAGTSLGTTVGIGSREPVMSVQQLWRTANKILQAVPEPDSCHLNDA